MLVSLCYVWLRWLLEFVALGARSRELKDLEIIVLRHELAILRRKGQRPATPPVDRVFLVQGEIAAARTALQRVAATSDAAGTLVAFSYDHIAAMHQHRLSPAGGLLSTEFVRCSTCDSRRSRQVKPRRSSAC